MVRLIARLDIGAILSLATVLGLLNPSAACAATWTGAAKGQIFYCTDPQGVIHSYQWSNNNNWTQSQVMGLDPCGDMAVLDASNWDTPSYPNGGQDAAILGGNPIVNGTINIGNLTLGSATITTGNSNPLSVAGTFTVSGNGVINGDGGISVNGPISGSGSLLVQSGSVLIGANSPDYTGTLTLTGGELNCNAAASLGIVINSGGNLGGNGNVTISSALTWNSGTMSGDHAASATTTIAPNATLTIQGAGSKSNEGRLIVNNGTTTWTGADVSSNYTGSFNNNGLFLVEADAYWKFGGVYFTTNPTPVFNNAGAFRKTSDGTTHVQGTYFSNSGLVDVQAGTLIFNAVESPVGTHGGGASTGEFRAASGALIQFVNNSQQFDSGASFTGGGTTQLSASPAKINGAVSVAGTLQSTMGSLYGTGTLTIQSTGTLQLDGTGTDLQQLTVENHGTIAWNSGNIYNTGAATINNRSDGLVVIQSNGTWGVEVGGSTNMQANNYGTIRKSGSSGTTDFGYVQFDNYGTIDTQSGHFDLSSGIATLHTGSHFTGAGTTRIVAPVVLAGAITSTNLELSAGGNLSGTGSITGTLNWTDGSITGSGTMTITPGSLLAIGANTSKVFAQATIVNNGSVTWSGNGDIDNYGGATLTNNGLFEIQNDRTYGIQVGGSPQMLFTNGAAGTIRKSGGSGTTYFGNVLLENYGTVDAQSGVLEFSSLTNLHDGSHLTGHERITYVTTLQGAISAENLELSAGGNLSGTGSITGTLNWTDGSITGSGTMTITPGSLLAIGANTSKVFAQATIVNNGSVTWSGNGDIDNYGGATLTNNGLFEIQNDRTYGIQVGGSPQMLFTNGAAGTIRKSGGSGTTYFGNVLLENYGTVDAQSGVLEFSSLTNLHDGSHLTGHERITYVTTLQGAISAENLELSAGGNLSGTGSITGTLNWTDGSITGSGTMTITPGSLLAIGANTSKVFAQATIVNNGSVTWSGNGDIDNYGGAIFDNHAGGQFNIQNNQVYGYQIGGSSAMTFQNAGTITKSSTGTTEFGNVAFTNSGNVDIQAGQLLFDLGYHQVAGSTIVSGTLAAVSVTLDAGQLRGSGRIVGNVTSAGTINPGNSPGTLSIDGALTQSASGTLQIEIGGITRGTQYDAVVISGSVSLGGTLNVSLFGGFSPAAGNSFDILDWGSINGTFSAIQLPTLSGTLAWNTSQLYTSGVLSVVSGVPGDYNNNGVVDAADFVLWRKNNNTAITLPNDSTLGTDPTDYAVWRAHFGEPPGSGAAISQSAVVPEPVNAVMLIFAAAGWCLRRSRAA